jgi:hypothetical protein
MDEAVRIIGRKQFDPKLRSIVCQLPGTK